MPHASSRGLDIVISVQDMVRVAVCTRFWYLCLTVYAGDIVHVRVLGQSIVALGSPEVIGEFLERRSSVTSDRVQSPLYKL